MSTARNLERAYRWLRTNPDHRYKNLFRDSYAAYAIASKMNLSRLGSNLRHQRFEASHASKVFTPKPSGVLRPITLLTVNDQIVYQACINIIAERLKRKTQKRYRKTVFNHLYAGKRSKYFYLKWEDNYKLFGNSVRAVYKKGNKYAAEFDLASFYDTIDHSVLRQFIYELGIDNDLCEFLISCLGIWTSSTWNNTSNTIYHGHGIPQGPLSSGMLSEVVLAYIDEVGERGRKTHYFRYVDDIKLYAKNELDLRQKLIALDIRSKEIGLFPQTSKINIHKINNIEDEIKSVSRPPEPSVGVFGNQLLLRKRILEITRGGNVDALASTRFKFLMGSLDPHHTLNDRLLKVLENQPEFSEHITKYFSRYKKLPAKTARKILEILNGEELYHSVHGELLRATLENMQDPERALLSNFCYQRLFGPPRRGFLNLPPQPTYKEAIISWLISNQRISYPELLRLRDDEVDWWVQKSIFRELNADYIGPGSYRNFINDSLRLPSEEVSRLAANDMIEHSVGLNTPYGDVNLAGKISLKAAGIIRHVGRPSSIINSVLAYVLSRPQNNYNWRRFHQRRHKHAEQIAVLVKRSFEVDIDACMARLDSFFDLIFEEAVSRLSPSTRYRNYGSVLNSPPGPVRGAIPNAIAGFRALHDLRITSITAHPRSIRTGSANRRLKHNDFFRVRASLVSAVDEIEQVIAP